MIFAEVAAPRRLPPRKLLGGLVVAALAAAFLVVAAICLVSALAWIDKPFPGFFLNERLRFPFIGKPHWSGTAAGLVEGDKLLMANGRALSSTRDLEDLVSRVKVGDPVVYAVERKGRVIDMIIPTMRFTPGDFFSIFGLYFLMGFIYFVCGLTVFILKPDARVSWVFFLAAYFAGLYFLLNFDIVATHWGFTKLYVLAYAILAATLIHLSWLFPETKELLTRHTWVQSVPYGISALLFATAMWSYPGPYFDEAYRFLTIYNMLGAVSLVASSFQSYFSSLSNIARQRARVLLMGAVLAFPIPVAANLLGVYGITAFGWQHVINPTFRIGPLFIFPAAVAYAIARHNLFDVDVYVKRAVGYGIMIGLLGLAFFSIQMLVSTTVLDKMAGKYSHTLYAVVFALLVVFFFSPLEHRVRSAVDRIFFRKKFDYKETILAVSNALTMVLDGPEVVGRIIHTLRREMFIDHAGVILFDPQMPTCQTYFIGESPQKGEDYLVNSCIPTTDSLVSALKSQKRLITVYDVAEDPLYEDVRQPCLARFGKMGASLLLPLMVQDEVIGALAVGSKKSGYFFSREDIDLLETLANQGAVALGNARLAERIKKEEAARINLSRYLSPQLVEEVLSKDVLRLGGERKVVTILISDIRNFIKITESLLPDRLVQILNEYFTEMVRVIFENQGSIDKYVGDSIIAVFGSLIPLENPARNAVEAAIAMMKELEVLNQKWGRQFRFNMTVGIGINTGEVFLGNIGSPERMEFTMIGDTVNIASRISDKAKPGQILVTWQTLSRLEQEYPYESLPPMVLKGKEGKLELYEIIYSVKGELRV